MTEPSPPAAAATSSPAPTTPAPEPSPQPAAAAPAATPQPSGPPKWETDLDAIDSAPEPKPAEKPAETAAKPAEKAAAKPAEKAPEKPAASAPEIPAFQTPKQLREWAKSRDAAAKSLEAEKQRLEGRLRELENVVPKTQQDAQLLSTKIAEYEKTISGYEQLLATHVFEQSPKFNREFQQPYVEARERAYRKMSELTVREPTGQQDEEGNPKFREREAGKADFDYIYSLPPRQARAEAKKMFGEDADVVLQQRERVSELAEKAIKAIEEHRTKYKDELQRAQASEVSKRTSQDQLWRKTNEAISSDPKRQEDWGTPKDDPTAAKALTDGFNLADLFFSEERDKMTPEDRVAFDANIRHRIAGFSLQRHLVKALRARNAELEAEVAALRGSEPGKPSPSADKPKATEKGVMEALEELPD